MEINVYLNETITKNINHEELSDENYSNVEEESGNTTEDETKTDAYDTEHAREENPITWCKDYMVGNDNGIEGFNFKNGESYLAFALNAESYVENNLPETIEDIQNRIDKKNGIQQQWRNWTL
ncbi:hypothetical protein WA026_017385 [Henosepilachna vigintioctopunctata]|uniref:Uncharacterized protein n=1 Tax=Henosepilachna vigintioctopunctata TaxID=420089 RepID=A0AAW1VGU6_9CUCU